MNLALKYKRKNDTFMQQIYSKFILIIEKDRFLNIRYQMSDFRYQMSDVRFI